MELNEEKLEERARKLGRAIGQTDAAKALDQAQQAIQDDEETRELFETLQREEQDLLQRARSGEDVSQDEQRELQEKMEELESKPAFQKYIAAQQNFEKIMKQVNEVIQEGIEEGQDSRIIEV